MRTILRLTLRVLSGVLLAAVLLTVVLPSGWLTAQTAQGVITGTVTDPSGAVVPSASVTITNEGTGVSQTDTAGKDGLYRFPLVPPGTYTVQVTAAGFKTRADKGIIVDASRTVPVNVTLGGA